MTSTEKSIQELKELKAEILMKLSDSRKILDDLRIEIGTQKAIFESEPQDVKHLLKNYTSLFTIALPTLESEIRKSDELRNEVLKWSLNNKSFSDLFNTHATIYECIKYHYTVSESWTYCLNEFKAKLKLTKEESILT